MIKPPLSGTILHGPRLSKAKMASEAKIAFKAKIALTAGVAAKQGLATAEPVLGTAKAVLGTAKAVLQQFIRRLERPPAGPLWHGTLKLPNFLRCSY